MRLSFESSADLLEEVLDSLDVRDRMVDEGRELAGAQQVERRGQRLQLRGDVEESERLGHQRELVETAAVAHRFRERVRMARARVMREAGVDRHLAEFEDLV